MQYLLSFVLATVVATGLTAHNKMSMNPYANSHEQKIELVLEDETLTATLNDSRAARDFRVLLPLTLELKDYARTEKVSDLPERLSTEGDPSGSKASAGDIAYYAPWGNLAIFYKDFRYSDGLVILGKIDGDIGVLRTSAPMAVTIRPVN